MSTVEIGWRRTSDAILKWALGLVGVGLIAAIALLLDIRVSMAVYQADSHAMKDRIDRVESWVMRHDQEDRARFQALERAK